MLNFFNFSAINPQSLDNFGQWEVITGNGVMKMLITRNQQFQGSLLVKIFFNGMTNECGTNTDQISINVLDGNPGIAQLFRYLVFKY